MNKPYQRPDLIELDPDKREWMYDGAGNKVYKNNYTNAWHTPSILSDFYLNFPVFLNRSVSHDTPISTHSKSSKETQHV